MKKKAILLSVCIIVLFTFQLVRATATWPNASLCKFKYASGDCGLCVCPEGQTANNGWCGWEISASCYNWDNGVTDPCHECNWPRPY